MRTLFLNLEPGSLGSGCQLVRFWVKSPLPVCSDSGIILISHIQMVNCINVRVLQNHFLFPQFYLPDIYLPMCTTVKRCCWYLPISIFSTIPCHFILSQISYNQYLSRFCFSSEIRERFGLVSIFVLHIILQKYVISFFCPCNDNQFHLYHSTHILFWTQFDPSNLINKLNLLKTEASYSTMEK